MQQQPDMQDELNRAHRALRLLSASNRTLLRASDETTLLHDVCRIAIEIGGYTFSWVGYKEEDKQQTVLPVASYGNGDGLLADAKMTWADGERGGDAFSAAIRTGTTQTRNHIPSDPEQAPWHSDAACRNYQSAIALPLVVDGAVIGAYAIYAPEPNAFTSDEIRLLDELASDLSFGIETIRLRKAHEKANAHITRLAYFDSLTNLPNRNYLVKLLGDAIAIARAENRPMALLLLDLDYIREINESYGHGIGDQILAQVAQKLLDLAGDNSIVARFGGNDFILVVNQADREQLVQKARHILAAIRQPISIHERSFSIGGSIGIALYPDDADCHADLLSRADLAMARIKESGGGYRFYQPEMTEVLSRKLDLAHRLESALSEGILALHYQPKVELYAGQIVGAEALLRWNDPVLGWVSPSEFIAVAEARGLMPQIGEWVLRTACQHLRHWKQVGVKYQGRVAVNVSARQLEDPYFLERVKRVLEETCVAPQLLELELTESCLMNDPDRMLAILKELRWLGFSIALDDFGTGYSSLSYLKRLPIDTLKIDQAFIMNMLNDSNDRAIISTILLIAQQMGLETVAEGVESEEQRKMLKKLGCVLAQGYYFCRPQPFEVFTNLRLTMPSLLDMPVMGSA